MTLMPRQLALASALVLGLIALAVATPIGQQQTLPPPTTTPPPTITPVIVPTNPPFMSRPTPPNVAAPINRSLSSVIVGQVVDNGGRAVPRAVVRLMGDRVIDTVVTDAKGRFAFRDVPLGEVMVTAEKVGYFSGGYGQRRASGLPLPFSLPFGQVMPNMRVEVYRAGVMTGVITDETGEPVVGVPVVAMRRQFVSGQWQYVTAGAEETDDLGEYRIFGLSPGEYILTAPATQIDAPPADGGDRVMKKEARNIPSIFPTTFYPSTDLRILAAPIPLAAGEVRYGMNLRLPLVRAWTVTGQLTGPIVAAQPLRLVPADANWADVRDAALTTSAGDGTFVFTRVPAGRYQLQAGLVPSPARPSASEIASFLEREPDSYFARVDVTIDDTNLDLSTVEMRPTASITGRIVAEPIAPSPQGPARLAGIAVSIEPAGPGLSRGTTLYAGADGVFSVRNLIPGEYFVRAATLPRGWFVQSIDGPNGDALDAPVDARDGHAYVELTLTSRATEVIGTVRDARMQFAAGAAIIIVPVAADGNGMWTPNRVRETRASTAGLFNVKGLPPGDYLVVAIDDAVAEGWQDPRRLAALRPIATRFTLKAADTLSLVLTMK